jgi:hypothetical protein
VNDLADNRREWLEKIKTGRERLAQVSEELKAHFVGLDEIIDKVIKNIEVWYVMPEVVSRPIIINLWGMTGVGKTDLVRRLVKGLDLGDRFVEAQLTNKGSVGSFWGSSLQGLLGYSNLDPGEPGILMLDEMQRFRSLDESGSEIHDYHFQDVWSLLSDGRFSGGMDSREEVLALVFSEIYQKDLKEAEPIDDDNDEGLVPNDEGLDSEDNDEPVKTKKPRKYQRDYFSAKRLKRLLRLDNDVEEIMTWDKTTKTQVLMDRMNDQEIYEGEDYSKLLIFVSGNIDEAYDMCDNCDNADVDADIFHERSLRINFLTIKDALARRFKPEQIARFGNTHVIYPSLSRASYEEIIRRRLKILQESVLRRFDINFNIDESISKFLYSNGVFPVQGTRPLFSTISACVENALPFFIFSCIEADQDNCTLSYNDGHIVGLVGGVEKNVKAVGDVDLIRKQNRKDPDSITLTAVHEAGHAVVYAILFGVAPSQITANATSRARGFVGVHEFAGSISNLKMLIAAYLAGRCSEELVFGKEQITKGASADIESATAVASRMVRQYGMGATTSKIQLPHGFQDSPASNNDYESSNSTIEDFLKTQQDVASEILKLNMAFMRSVAGILMQENELKPEKFAEVAATHGYEVRVVDSRETIYGGQRDAYNEFVERVAQDDNDGDNRKNKDADKG